MNLSSCFLVPLFVVSIQGHCCPPKQYVVDEDIYGAVKKPNGSIEITRGKQHVTYDVLGQRIAIHGIDNTKNIISDVIMDFKQGKEYVWANGVCRVMPLGNFTESCIPEGANLLHKSYMGETPNEIPTQMYNYQKDTMDIYASVTEECIPMAAQISSETKGFIEFAVYANFTVGISDMNVFTPPDICQHQGMNSPHIAGRRRRMVFL